MACLHESQVLAFIAGERDERALEHIDECDACRQLLAELVRKNQPTDPGLDETALPTDKDRLPPVAVAEANEWVPGTRVGRYVVLSRIGRGGMGTVYRAEDVELSRPVALKRLHADADAESRARLVREARSAAQLQHPNVVTVHEVGEHAGTPFLAMELVDGVTLTAWLEAKTRSWREVVDIVAQAGRGLAAAHDRGLVHRDFKPDNVMVDRTGRARVADFGLARAGDATPSEPNARHISHETRLTATGSLAGTPAYMAPELVDGAPPDARSDQYALAITLYEALRGQHPFAGQTAARLWVEMAAGNIRGGGRPVPAWLDKHVRRGLAVPPAERWPDVASFVAAIGKPPRGRIWIAGALGITAIAATVAVVALREAPASGPTCDDLANEYQPSFDPEALARAIPDPAQIVLANQALARFGEDYRKAMRDSCRATRAGTQSAAVGDKRTACLERAKRRAWYVTSGITSGLETRPGLAMLLDELPDVFACGDPKWLERAAPPPVSATARDAIYVAESDLSRAAKARDDGDLAAASRLLARVQTTARELDDRALDARASLLAAEIARDRGDTAKAELEAVAAWSAASVSGDDKLTLSAQLSMLLATASRGKPALEAFAGLGTVAESADGARLIVAYGDALMASGKFAEGEREYRRAQVIRENVLPAGHVERALGKQRIGAALVVQKRAAEALPILADAHAVIEKAFPPLRREAIEGVRYLAMAEAELGHEDRALALYREVYDRRAKVLGPKGGLALEARKDYASALCDLGDAPACMHELEETIAGFVELAGERTSNLANTRISYANQLIGAERFAEAEAQLAKAMPVLEKIYGADSPYAMVGLYAQVRLWVAQGTKLDEAVRGLDRIEPVFTKLFGASSHPSASVIRLRARIALARHDAKRAETLIAQAIEMFDEGHLDDRAEAKLVRADALAALGRQDEARTLADAAAADFERAGPGFATRAASARAWPAKPAAPSKRAAR